MTLKMSCTVVHNQMINSVLLQKTDLKHLKMLVFTEIVRRLHKALLIPCRKKTQKIHQVMIVVILNPIQKELKEATAITT